MQNQIENCRYFYYAYLHFAQNFKHALYLLLILANHWRLNLYFHIPTLIYLLCILYV